MCKSLCERRSGNRDESEINNENENVNEYR